MDLRKKIILEVNKGINKVNKELGYDAFDYINDVEISDLDVAEIKSYSDIVEYLKIEMDNNPQDFYSYCDCIKHDPSGILFNATHLDHEYTLFKLKFHDEHKDIINQMIKKFNFYQFKKAIMNAQEKESGADE